MDSRLVNGVRIYAPHSREALIESAFANRSLLVAVNAEKIMHATEQTRAIINRNVGYPDGIGAILCLRQKGQRDAIKIPGCELWLDIIRASYREVSFYFVGGREHVIETTITRLCQEFPGIRILGYRNGYFVNESEKTALITTIASTKPDVVFVGIGSPQQEFLMEEMRSIHPAVYQGLGGSFDVYTGEVHRAPAWWVEHNLEWLYRLLKQPTRIKRQVHLFRFLMQLFTGRF